MTGSNEVINPEIIFPECQKRHIFMLLMCAGGFYWGFYIYFAWRRILQCPNCKFRAACHSIRTGPLEKRPLLSSANICIF